MTLSGAYDPVLVGLSVFVAVFASYTTFEVVGQLRTARGYRRLGWLAGAAVAAGGAIWSMHFVGMLAFDMGMPVQYDLSMTLASLALPMVVTGLGIAFVARECLTAPRLAAGGALMGLGIVVMHYLGMAGMEMGGVVHYDPVLVGLSALIAVSASTAALWLVSRQRSLETRLASACAMGGAIAGMHYTGMAAASFAIVAGRPAPLDPMLEPALLASMVAITTALILLLAIAVVHADRQKALAAEKETLLREVHHRVKNNLQLISSLINLEARSIDDRAALERLKDLQARIAAIGSIHTKLYQANDIARIDFGAYLEDLVQDIETLHRRACGVVIEVKAAPLLCDVDTAIPLGLMVNEALTNSLKHGFPGNRAGRIEIAFRRSDPEGHVELIVADDGVGPPEGAGLTPSGLGMRLMRGLARQIDAQVATDRGTGMRVRVTIDRNRFRHASEVARSPN